MSDFNPPPGFDYHDLRERTYQRWSDEDCALDTATRHTGYTMRKGPEGYRAFPAPPAGWRLVWEAGDEPRLERAA